MEAHDLYKLQANAELAVNLLKKMSHKDRLLILCYLIAGEMSAGELNKCSLLSQSAFSQHLAILRKEGLVRTRKEGQTIYYSLAKESVVEILKTLKQIFCN